MKVEGVRLNSPEVQVQPVGAVVEAVAVEGKLPDLLHGQRFTATVIETNGSQALINVQGAHVGLPAVPGLTPGAELQVRVASVAPRLLLEVISGPPPANIPLPPLAVGQQVDIEILDELPNGRVRVDVQGTILEADIAQGVQIGARVHATVEQLQPQVVLHLLANTEQSWQNEVIRLLRNTVGHHMPVGESLQTLWSALSALTQSPAQDKIPASATKLYDLLKTLFQNTGPPTVEQLAAFVRDGGLHYETKLLRGAEQHSSEFTQIVESDVKGLLLQLTQDLEKAQAGQHTLAAASLHLEHIVNQQAVNLLAHAQGEPYQLQIPLFTDQGITTAFIAIEANEKGHGEEKESGSEESRTGYHILFLLDLEGLGQTRIEAQIGAKSLWGVFYVDRPSSVTLLQTELPAFREILQTLGYDEVLLLAKPLGHLSAEKRKKFDALEGGIPTSVHLLDVRA